LFEIFNKIDKEIQIQLSSKSGPCLKSIEGQTRKITSATKEQEWSFKHPQRSNNEANITNNVARCVTKIVSHWIEYYITSTNARGDSFTNRYLRNSVEHISKHFYNTLDRYKITL